MEKSRPLPLSRAHRPVFPKRAVVTAGMPYGNKALHFGHVGGVFVFADVYARFLRDRIGKENVIFVSGTDCYGSPIVESYRKACNNGFTGSLLDFVRGNHNTQKETLSKYDISLDLYGVSAAEIGRAGEVHHEYTQEFIRSLYDKGSLEKVSTAQFFDEKENCFLNGRQVVGKCPVQGCRSEKAYADECDLGHQYMPISLIEPKSTLSDTAPVMRNVDNWYFKLPEFSSLLKEYAQNLNESNPRKVVRETIADFLEPPCIHIMNDYKEQYSALNLPKHELIEEGKKSSFTIIFKTLPECDKAVELLSAAGVRFRTGKTLVPFRLTGNIEWGAPAPSLEGEKGLTVWVWPESLWAPISFTKAYLENDEREWVDFWCNKNAKIYQFIGQDNIYFYGIAQQAMFMALGNDQSAPEDGQLQLSTLVAAHHLLFLDKKASSSGNVKPPMADELLEYYTAEQLRMHFLSLGLGLRSVSFKPKALNPLANESEPEPVTKEGFLLSNVFNRIVRTCFYELQANFNSLMPLGDVSDEILAACEKAVLEYERYMYKFEFHQVTYVLDSLIRFCSKFMAREKAAADKANCNDLRKKWLIDVFHVVKTAVILLHPLVPSGTELVRDYLNLDESFWGWDNIFNSFSQFLNKKEHELKFLPPKTDFFKKHETQLNG
ncbi:MAG: class I tRNA ligase family protein [Oscillospiraceae bacterium]|nr:class I tRNA ligase family protein [Oscillospiraceae bacterium]